VHLTNLKRVVSAGFKAVNKDLNHPFKHKKRAAKLQPFLFNFEETI